MDPRVQAALENTDNWYKLPINQVLANYFAYDTDIPNLNQNWSDYSAGFFIRNLLDSHQDKILKLVFSKPNSQYKGVLEAFFGAIHRSPDFIADAYKFAVPNEISENVFFARLMHSNNHPNLLIRDEKPTNFGKLLAKDKAILTSFFNAVISSKYSNDYLLRYSAFFVQHCPELLVKRFAKVIYIRGYRDGFNCALANKLLALDKDIFEELIHAELANGDADFSVQQSKFQAVVYLFRSNKKKYKEFYLDYIHKYLDYFTKKECYPFNDHIFVDRDISRLDKDMKILWWSPESFSMIYWIFDHLRAFSVADFEMRIKDFCKNTAFMPKEIIPMVRDHFNTDSIEILKDIFDITNHNRDSDYPIVLIESLEGLDWAPYSDVVWKYCSKLNFQTQAKVVKTLIGNPDLILPFAESGISKTKTERLLSYLVFANLDSTKQTLWDYFQKEKDDNVRELILPIIKRIFYGEGYNLKKVDQLVQYAVDRDAYKKGLKGVILDFDQLPDIYLENGKKLNENQVKFLIYRMSMIKVMQSDTEAKLLINHIDKTKSNEFAKAILEAFLAKGAPAKQKYIMCLAGILGDESLLGFLQKLFRDLHDGKRLKMAQYVISTIAMIGTDKALRHVEYISRKYKRKASLEAAAIEALENAAEEMGMDIYELSDKIIPDFGFDGLYKTIDVNGEELRVFVAKDFKLQFITEEGKVRKSVPKAASKELKAELKTIQKEIREVNRAQKDRLEQYMVLERRWNLEDWTKFYLMNPVMFIYASTLVWGVFDDKNKLKNIFYVDEDASLLDIEDDEIEIENGKIGMIHPLRLSEEQKSAWTAKLYEYEIVQPFQQLDRPSFLLSEADKTAKKIVRYHGKGASKGNQATQGHFERRGWRKEVSDGGCFDFSKTFKQEGMYAFLSLEGLCIGWYDEKVMFHNIHFMKIGEYAWKDEEFIPLKDVPAIMYSEVIADMEAILEVEEEG